MIRIVSKIWPVLVIFFLWFVFCFPYFGHGLVPFPSKYLVTFFPPWNASYAMPVKNNAMPDIITQLYPWKQITIDLWKQGQIPLWNPYAFGGTPHGGNYQTAVFNPMNMLFFILPFIDAWSIMILLQPLLAGIGMYLFMQSLDRSKIASAVGAIGFMFCGFITTWMAYGTLGYAALMLPWIVWSIAINFKKNASITRITLPLFIALSFLSGHFQISLYVCIASVAFICFEGWQKKNWKETGRSLLGVCIGIGLAAPQLLITYHAYFASTRLDSFIRSEVIPWHYIITLFSPDFYGNPVTRNDWFGHYAEWASYVGVVPLVFAVISLFSSMKGYKKYFLTLIGVVIALAFPTPIADHLFRLKVPIFSTSAASRIIFLLSFAVVGLASFGFDELREEWKKRMSPKVRNAVMVQLVLLIIVWMIVVIFKILPEQYALVAKRNLILPSVLFAVTVGCVIFGFYKGAFIRKIAVLILISIALFDMYRYATKWMPFDEKKYIYPESSSIAFIKKNIDLNRVFGNISGEVGNTYKLPLIEGYDAMYQARFGEFMNASSDGIVAPAGRSVVSFDKYGRFKDVVLKLLAVRYIYQRKSDGRNVWAFPVWEYLEGEMVKRFEDEHYEVYEYTKSYPRAFLASSYEIQTNDRKIIDRLFSPDFSSRNTLILEQTPIIEPTVGEGVVRITSYSPMKVTIFTKSTAPKLVFLSDTYDSGWQATIDGKATPVYRADYSFRAVGVPAGTHTIEYRYHPIEFRIGILVALVSIIVLGITML